MTTVTRRRALFGALALLAVAATSVDVQAEPGSTVVAFNTKSFKYHCPECEWAIKCTRNCVLVSRDVAEARGGIPCKICRGTCGRAITPGSDHAFPSTCANGDVRSVGA